MTRLRFFTSSIGTKLAIAVTGLGLAVFLVLHLAGNLLALVGPTVFNEYGHALVSNPFLVPTELGLLAFFLIHVYKTGTNWLANRRARPSSYAVKRWAGGTSRKNVGSSTMIVSGIVIFVFLVLHLKTFKYGAYYLVTDGDIRDLHRLVVEVFQNPFYVGFYVVSMVLVGFHLRHGLSSAIQSLGIDHPRYTPQVLRVGVTLAILIAAGFALIPIVIYLRGGS